MVIDNDLLDKLAYLARLEVPSEQRAEMLYDLNAMADWVSQLSRVELPQAGVVEIVAMREAPALREDIAHNTLSHEAALVRAPSCDTNYFRVPAVRADQA